MMQSAVLQELETHNRLTFCAATRQVMYSDRDRRRDLYIDLSIGLGIPIIMVPLHYVVQPYRMGKFAWIMSLTGTTLTRLCIQTSSRASDVWLHTIPVSLVCSLYSCGRLDSVWPASSTLVSGVCFRCMHAACVDTKVPVTAFALRWFIIRRTQFNAILQSSGSGLNRVSTLNSAKWSANALLTPSPSVLQAKYLRLMLLAATELFLSFPLALYVFITNTKSNPYQPFNWDAVHADWNVTGSYTPDMLGLSTIAATHITRWFALVACWIFFAFFGLTPEVSQGADAGAARCTDNDALITTQSRAYYSVCYNAVLVACRLRKPKSPMAPL